jgi:hypothetical protein
MDIFLHHDRGKQGLLSLIIDGLEIASPTNFGIVNAGPPVDVNNPPPSAAVSSIQLGYASPTDAFPGFGGFIPGHAAPWNAGLWLVGAEGVISRPQDILDIDNWNELATLRRLDLDFGYPETVSVRAIVGDFVGVPEPSSTYSVLVAVALIMAFFLFRSLGIGSSFKV